MKQSKSERLAPQNNTGPQQALSSPGSRQAPERQRMDLRLAGNHAMQQLAQGKIEIGAPGEDGCTSGVGPGH